MIATDHIDSLMALMTTHNIDYLEVDGIKMHKSAFKQQLPIDAGVDINASFDKNFVHPEDELLELPKD